MQAGGWLRDPRYDAGLDELARLDAADAASFAARCRVLARLAARTSREGWQGDAPFDSLVLDVAGTCLLGQVAAGSRLVDAEHLVLRLPAVLAALEEGALRVPQAQVFLEQTRTLTPAVCAEVERRVLPEAPQLCPADLRRLLRRVVLEVDAEAVRRREAEARSGRRTWVRAAEDGMGLLCALLPAEQAQQVQAALTEQARQARAAGDGRDVDQLRADLLVERCTSLVPAGAEASPPRTRGRAVRPVRVVVHVPLAVALGLSDAAAELEGYGPVSAAHARRLLAGAELQRASTDPRASEVLALDRPVAAPGAARDPLALHRDLRRLADGPPPVAPPPEPQHDPSAALAQVVRARDARCDGPGCSVPASRCELDHEVPWPEGATSVGNLAARSQRCHHAKHAGWTAERTPAGTAWTSPGGRRYLVPPRRGLPPLGPPTQRERRAALLAQLRWRLVATTRDGGPEPDRGRRPDPDSGSPPALGRSPADAPAPS